ncbi:MAG: aminotransferase class I/II-fold pyridoxal phosphate-dependent enzyme, partial [Candidatus Devosia euplotis]|nr:aminotransferase class I/II-fold pyridoxal phosphate-dependent enzyme [Candidatus Devosia euplotis]
MAYYREHYGVAVDADAIICTTGSSAGFILAFHIAFRPGAWIAITRPGYPAYVNTLLGLGFGIAEIPLSVGNGWRLTGADIAAAHAREPLEELLFAQPGQPRRAGSP